MSEPIRILQVFAQMNRGGAETMIMNLYRNIDRSKVQFDFIVHTEDECDYDKEILELGGKLFKMPRYTMKNHFHYIKTWIHFFQQNLEHKIIHGHVRSTAAIYLPLAKKCGLKTIAHSHSTSSGNGFSAIVKGIMQYPIRYISDYFFACSIPAGTWLFGKKVLTNKNFHVVHNAIESEKYIYNEMIRVEERRKLGVDDRFVVGHIGRFHPLKNHKFIVEIFHEIHKQNNDAILLLVGRGELEETIKEMVQNLGLKENVIFAGVRSDVHKLLQVMDVFLFPSIFEGLGNVIIEAQAAGLSCVVSEVIPEEAKITDKVHSVCLEESATTWANLILRYSHGFNREDTSNKIKDNNFDVGNVSKWIEEFYLSMNIKSI